MNSLSRLQNGRQLSKSDFFSPFEQVFDNFFTDFFKGTSVVDQVKSQVNYPKVDISTEDDYLVLRAAIPGVKPDDVQVEMITDNTVEISGKFSSDYQSSEDNYVVRELSKRTFSRRIQFKNEVKEPLSAHIKDGILTIKWDFPREKPPNQKKKIIKVTSE